MTTDSKIVAHTCPSIRAPGGHYSHAILASGLIFLSGQLGVRPDGTHTSDESFEVQTQQVFENARLILRSLHAGWGDVVRVTTYVGNIKYWEAFDRIYAEIFGEHRPARTVVPTSPLHLGYLVEVDLIAIDRSNTSQR